MTRTRIRTIVTLVAGAAAACGVLIAARADAQLRAMGIPIRTTMVLAKPAPGQLYGNKPVVTMAVGTRKYKFLVNDAYVDDATGRIRWPDVWEYVRFHQPNFIVQGENADTFEKIKPGQELTIKGMFAPLDRTLEVVYAQPGRGGFEPSEHR
jgi:hypothetical protein